MEFFFTVMIFVVWTVIYLGTRNAGSSFSRQSTAREKDVDLGIPVPDGFELTCKVGLDTFYRLRIYDKGHDMEYFFAGLTTDAVRDEARKLFAMILPRTEIFPNGDYTRNMARYDKDGNILSGRTGIIRLDTHGALVDRLSCDVIVMDSTKQYGMFLTKLDGETIRLYADSIEELQAKADPYYYEILESQTGDG